MKITLTSGSVHQQNTNNVSHKPIGQFYTTNTKYILSGFECPTQHFVEPFCGNGDLIKFFVGKTSTFYDIDPKIAGTIKIDSLLFPPDFTDRFIITNPPFLARNKNEDKTIYKKHNVDDTYKAFLKTMVLGNALGGIIILPINFLCDEDHKIRDFVLSKFKITKCRLFEEQVFEKTTYTTGVFQFERGEQVDPIPIEIFPSKKTINVQLKKAFGWRIGGEIYEKEKKFKNFPRIIKRLEQKTNNTITPLFLRAVDGGSPHNKISLSLRKEPFYAKNTERVFATITCDQKLERFDEIANLFNERLEKLRKETQSLFLTNFRCSTQHYARKRISFSLAYAMINEIIFDLGIK